MFHCRHLLPFPLWAMYFCDSFYLPELEGPQFCRPVELVKGFRGSVNGTVAHRLQGAIESGTWKLTGPPWNFDRCSCVTNSSPGTNEHKRQHRFCNGDSHICSASVRERGATGALWPPLALTLRSPSQALELLPALDKSRLKGALLYTEAQHHDARMGLYLALTAAHWGACMLNHMKVLGVVQDEKGQVQGITVKDQLEPKAPPLAVRAKVVVNACGADVDSIMTQADPKHEPLVQPAAGTWLRYVVARIHLNRGYL